MTYHIRKNFIKIGSSLVGAGGGGGGGQQRKHVGSFFSNDSMRGYCIICKE